MATGGVEARCEEVIVFEGGKNNKKEDILIKVEFEAPESELTHHMYTIYDFYLYMKLV